MFNTEATSLSFKPCKSAPWKHHRHSRPLATMLRTRAVQRGVMRVRVPTSTRHTLRWFFGGHVWRRGVSFLL